MIITDTGPLVAVANDRDDHHQRCLALLERHMGPALVPAPVVDACVIAVAERLAVREIATLDRKHFSVVRPDHIPAFTLLPD